MLLLEFAGFFGLYWLFVISYCTFLDWLTSKLLITRYMHYLQNKQFNEMKDRPNEMTTLSSNNVAKLFETQLYDAGQSNAMYLGSSTDHSDVEGNYELIETCIDDEYDELNVQTVPTVYRQFQGQQVATESHVSTNYDDVEARYGVTFCDDVTDPDDVRTCDDDVTLTQCGSKMQGARNEYVRIESSMMEEVNPGQSRGHVVPDEATPLYDLVRADVHNGSFMSESMLSYEEIV